MRGLIAALVLVATPAWAEPVRIGSENFTESYLLAEIAAQHLEARGVEVVRQFGLGGTKICYDALRASEIDLYPEYTGTIARSEEHTSELQSRPHISYAVFCLKKKK